MFFSTKLMRIVAKGKESKVWKHPSKSHFLQHKKQQVALLDHFRSDGSWKAYKMIPNITNILLGELEEQTTGEISLSNDADGHSTTTARTIWKATTLICRFPTGKKQGCVVHRSGPQQNHGPRKREKGVRRFFCS